MRLLQQQYTLIRVVFVCIISLSHKTVSQEKNQIQAAINKYFWELSTTVDSENNENKSLRFYKQQLHSDTLCKHSKLPGIDVQYKNFTELDSYLGGRIKYLNSFEPFLKKKLSLTDLDDETLSVLLNEVFTVPRNHVAHQNVKTSVALLIGWLLAQNGNIVGAQKFMPKQFLYLFKGKKIEGLNMISILPGTYWGTSKDRIIVVGSHYDTVENSAGYNDNGSGTAALIKIHQKVSKSKKCKRRFSVIFVAFDLEEYGFHGSHAFVEEFLKPEILDKFNQTDFQFAFVLDSIINYNETEGSQKYYPDAPSTTPHYYNFVRQNKERGDYISLIGRKKEESQLIKQIMASMQVKAAEIILGDFDSSSVEKLTKIFNYLRSDHIKFWFANLKAIAVTDTGNLRGVMQSCYHNSCDHPSQNTTMTPFANINFFNGIINSIVDVIIKNSC